MINKKSNLESRLEEGGFVITSEFGLPRGVNTSSIKDRAQLLVNYVDAVNISDLQGSNLSMDRLAAAHLLINLGLEPVLQMTCRDRNRLSLQSDILSAHVLGIRNILALTGDYPNIGDHPSPNPVFDLDSVQLLWAISKLQEGHDLSGGELTSPPSFFTGAAVKVEADTDASFELQLIKMKKKVGFGARFFQTMPIFDADKFLQFTRRAKELDINAFIIAGIQLIKSEKMADYMNKHLPGVKVPGWIIKRIAASRDKAKESIDIAASIVNKIRPACSGIHIGAQGWEDHIPELISKIDI